MGIQLSLDGQRALVTGSSSGLGPVIARALDEAGAEVILHYNTHREGAERTAASLSRTGGVLQADLSVSGGAADLFHRAAEGGPVTILVNCAAVESQEISPLIDLETSRWSDTLRSNVEAPFELIRCFARQGVQGSVINISSIEGSRPASAHGHYATSKAALDMLTRSAALELGPAGIRVNAIAPGLIWRQGIEEGWPEGVAAWKTAAPLGRLVSPEDIGAAVVFLASGLAASMTGTVLTVDAGVSVRPGWGI